MGLASIVQNITQTAGEKITAIKDSISGAVSPNRLSGTILDVGGVQKTSSAGETNVSFSKDDAVDWRVKVSINPTAKILYRSEKPGVLQPLLATDGFIFPYVPQITVSHNANYSQTPVTHANYAQYFYDSSSVGAITVTGDFTVQNKEEALYFLAGIYFFRSCTKMFYGLSYGNEFQGAPPPIVYLDGFGSHYLPHIPCVVTGFSHTMPSDVDYMEATITKATNTIKPEEKTSGGSMGVGIKLPQVNVGNGQTAQATTYEYQNTRVPTMSAFTVTLQPIYSRNTQRDFSYAEFARGDLINQGLGGML